MISLAIMLFFKKYPLFIFLAADIAKVIKSIPKIPHTISAAYKISISSVTEKPTPSIIGIQKAIINASVNSVYILSMLRR